VTARHLAAFGSAALYGARESRAITCVAIDPLRRSPTIRATNRVQAAALVLALLTTSTYAQTDAVSARIDRILREVPLIDGLAS